MNKTFTILAMIALLSLSFSACNRGPSVDQLVAQATDSNVKRIAKVYTIFMLSHDWQGPQDANELKEFILKQNNDRMRTMGIDPDNLDSLFLNERDEQPLKVRWKLKGSPTAPPFAVVFESTPDPEQEQKYLVGFTGSATRQVDQSEYDRLWSGEADWEGGTSDPRR
ncbi:MAG: hypothetical protein MK108_16655 [Mariniblastus sp.]|nr:hypothetical protein [Mariniblastus sp.]